MTRAPLILSACRFAALGFATATLSAAPPATTVPPRLAVVISIDQCRADYLVRFAPYFCAGGFRRLLDHGTTFKNCFYDYASTITAVGHTTMLAGVDPDVHGIVGNAWMDRETWQQVIAVEDHQAPLVGLAPQTMNLPGGVLDPRSGRSPRRCLAPNLGDQLKLRYGKGAKVFGVSNKDRAAILMAGKSADGAYWEDDGRFITSRYYRDALPAWAVAFNQEARIDACFGKTWDRLLDAKIYDDTQGPDDAEGEFVGSGLGRTFPHTFDGGSTTIGRDFHGVFDLSPFASEVLEAFTERLVTRENLGRDDTPDLLCLSFSQTDYAGHAYGTDSHEIMDSMLRLDRTLAHFLDFLDQQVGLAHCVIVITADHGAAPMPERTRKDHPEIAAGRVPLNRIDAIVGEELSKSFGAPAEPWVIRDSAGYQLRPTTLTERGVSAADAAAVVKRTLLAQPSIEAAFTRAEILAAPHEGSSLVSMIKRSFLDSRGQDVVFVLKKYSIDRIPFGTTHGTPWDYDRHVPLVWFGPGVDAGTRTEPVNMLDLAPTLAGILGIPAPPHASGRNLFSRPDEGRL